MFYLKRLDWTNNTIFTICTVNKSGVQKQLYWHFSSYKGSAAEQDHEDDEALKPVVLHDPEAGLSKRPPHLPPAHFRVYLTTLELLHTAWGRDKGEMVIYQSYMEY